MRPGFVTPDNMAMLTDLYELAMAASYREHLPRERATFELFVRKVPPGRSYMVFAGLEQAILNLRRFSFGHDAIRFLRSTRLFP